MTKTETASAASQSPSRKEPLVEKRLHGRRDTELNVQLYWKDDTGALHDENGVVVNASAGGFGVEASTGLGVGRLVTVRTFEGSSIQCVVRHRQDRPDSVLMGLEVVPAANEALQQESLNGLSNALKDE